MLYSKKIQNMSVLYPTVDKRGRLCSHPFRFSFPTIVHANKRDKDGLLSLREFKSALTSSGAGLTPAEIRALFTHLENGGGVREGGGGGDVDRGGDGNGTAPWRVLLSEIRPPLSGETLGLVRLAFRRMDRTGEGSVSPDTLIQRYCIIGHYHYHTFVLALSFFCLVFYFTNSASPFA